MKKDIQFLILKDKFEDSKIELRLPIVVNAIFAIFLIIFAPKSPFLFYCLFSALLLLTPYFLYNWKTPFINIGLSLVYLMIFLAEILFHGIPDQAIAPDYEMSKGIFMDILLAIVPFVYSGLRLLAIIPLLKISWLADRMRKYQPKS